MRKKKCKDVDYVNIPVSLAKQKSKNVILEFILELIRILSLSWSSVCFS
jgi:hypothetical protein